MEKNRPHEQQLLRQQYVRKGTGRKLKSVKRSMSLCRRCEEATEVETHHQQTAATTMGVAEDETPSSLTSHPNPNVNNPNQEGTCQNCSFHSRVGTVRTPADIEARNSKIRIAETCLLCNLSR